MVTEEIHIYKKVTFTEEVFNGKLHFFCFTLEYGFANDFYRIYLCDWERRDNETDTNKGTRNERITSQSRDHAWFF